MPTLTFGVMAEADRHLSAEDVRAMMSDIERAAQATGFDLVTTKPGLNRLAATEDRLLLLEVASDDDGTHLHLSGYTPADDPFVELYRITDAAPPDLAGRTWVFPGLVPAVTAWLAPGEARQADVVRTALEEFLGWFAATVIENEALKAYVAHLEGEVDRLRAEGAQATAALRDQLVRYEQLTVQHRLLTLESQKSQIDGESSRGGLKVLTRVVAAFLAGALLTPVAGDLATAWGQEVLPYPDAEEVRLRCEQTTYVIEGAITEVEQP
ncbi:MAG TPA: hypothetical protein VFU19_05650 [Iamia sp.]|nr:hypothetical protein [Iamia sp.]